MRFVREPARVHSIRTTQNRSPGSDLTFTCCVYRYFLRMRFPHVYLMSSHMAKDELRCGNIAGALTRAVRILAGLLLWTLLDTYTY